MSMGERIRLARQEAGLSQRQLAGEMMTRNMLSVLENDGAKPSVATLAYLSEKLCKPIGYFFGEPEPGMAEGEAMEAVRRAYAARDYAQCLKLLEDLQRPEFKAERSLLRVLSLLELARQARQEGRNPYSLSLLEQCEEALEVCPYLGETLRRRWLVESAAASPEKDRIRLALQIPAEDEVLLLRARGMLGNGQFERAGQLLDSADNRSCGEWNFLRGEVYFAQEKYAQAIGCYEKALPEMSGKCCARLEICHRELGDYKMAYYYVKLEKTGKTEE